VIPRRYDFSDRMAMSHGVSMHASIEQVLLHNVPGARAVAKAERDDERRGVDYWVTCDGAVRIAIDLKARSDDYSLRGEDDLALEVWSVKEKSIAGWTLQSDKRTDYILWYWKDTGRWCLVPFKMLVAVFVLHRDEWLSRFKHREQTTPSGNGGWTSECVFVPRRDIWAAIYRRFSGRTFEEASRV